MHPQVWVTSGHVGSFSDPLVECQTDHRRFRLDELPGAEDLTRDRAAGPGHRRAARAAVPGRRRPAVGAAPVQPDVQDVHGPGRGGRLGHLPAPGDRAGLVRQLQERPAVVAQEAAVRDRPDRQVVPQRDHARATSSSGCASSSRWRCSTSSGPRRRRPPRSRSGCPTRRAWYERYGVTPDAAAPARARARRAGPLREEGRSTSSTASRSAGRSSRASTTAATSTCRATPRRRARSLEYFDQATDEHVIPWIVETAAGADRAAFTFLIDAYREEEVRGETRVVARAPSRPRAVQGRRPAAAQEAARDRRAVPPDQGRPAAPHDGRLRRHGRDRQALPPPGRDRDAVVRHGRRRLARGRRGHGPRPRLDDPGARARSRA